MRKKLLVLILLLSSIFIPSVYAKGDSEVLEDAYCIRSSSNNYGVNKKWEITDKNRGNALATECVDPSKKVYDFAGVLSNEEEEHIRSLINAYTAKHKAEIVILLVDFPYSSDSLNEEYAADFYDYNDFGLEFESYSGTVLLRNVYSSDPYFNIYTFGEDQLYFSGSRTESTLDYIYNDLHSHDYVSGFEKFISNWDDYRSKGIPSEHKNDYIDANGVYHTGFTPAYFIYILSSGIVTAICIGIQVSRNSMVHTATQASDYLDKDSVDITKSENRFKNSITTSTVISSSSSGGGGHSIGSSGGGHSSGGGRHG